MIEEEIEGISCAMTPAAGSKPGHSAIASQINTFSAHVMSSAPPSKQNYNWQCYSEDRSELLSQSRGVGQTEMDRSELLSQSRGGDF